MRRNFVWLMVVLTWACGGGTPIKEGGKAASELKGRVIKGPVAHSTVVAYRASSTLDRGAVLAEAKSDESGEFTLALPPYQGHVLVVAVGGTYTEESIGLGVQLGENALELLLPDFTTGTRLEGLRLTPVSTLGVALARFHAGRGRPVAEGHREALEHLHQHFGGVDWSAVVPADLSVPGVTNLAPESRAGLVLAGLSWLAKQQAEASDVSAGLVVNAATLTSALARDGADGTFDGRAGAEALKQAKAPLSSLTMRSELVQGITGYINSSRNASALKLQDVTAFLASIGTNNDPYLFCPGQVASPSCGTGAIDTEPPVLEFIKPRSGAGVSGSVEVEVRASDNVALKVLRFSSPPSLMAVTPVFDGDSHTTGVLTATLDVSAMPDGPVEIRAEVADAFGNPAAKAITVKVSNLGPRIIFNAPGAGSTVRGSSVLISASATAQAPGATIQRLELVNPPAGVGSDTLPASDSFSAAWNTAMASEGLTTLTIRATDSFDTSTELSVSVNVDNVPVGQVSTTVTAGAPVDGLKVKLVAIDDLTGLPVVGRMGGPVLGQSTNVTVDGGVTFELTQENYSGPVQLVAEGTQATYLDPSDGRSLITLPTNFALTSYVEVYRAGERLERPITFATTLADVAARAYAQGKNPAQPSAIPLTTALRVIDGLFAKHVTSSGWSLRTVVPVPLTATSQSLRDGTFAAFIDVALNQQARELASEVGLTAGTGLAAPQFVAMLLQDVSDGQFDGKAAGVQLQTAGTTPYLLDANTTRFRQAIALDRFIRSSQNRSQLTRQDLQTSGVFDTISGDTSLLYPATAAPVAFDNTPPVVTWNISFQKEAQVTSGPVGGGNLVRGVLQVAADAVDPTGVASLAVRAGGGTVVPGQGTTPGGFRGSVDVSAVADGTFTLTALACDRLGNCGETSYILTVDNTPPTVAPLKPTANAYVSASFDIEATSSDANGLASFAVTSPAGGMDLDTSTERLLVSRSSWILAWPEGPQAVSFRSCDVVGNCTAAQAPVVVDRTPPSVVITSQPPEFTRSALITLSGTVSDGVGAGVGRVVVEGGSREVTATLVGGTTWSASVELYPGVRNELRVWAEDRAEAPNSGRGTAASDVAVVTSDTTPLTVLTRAAASYRDERGLKLSLDPQGRPVIPVSYTYAETSNRVVAEGGVAYKIRSKAGPSDDNIPFLRWAVVQDPAPASTPASATFAVVSVNGAPCPSGACTSGALRVSSAVEPGFVLYELPLHLGTLPGFGVLTIRAIFRDKADNVTVREFAVTYTAVGAPVAVVADNNFESYRDPASVYPYTLSFSNYVTISSTSTRVLRWVVYNPNAETVWVSLSGFAGSWKENWWHRVDTTPATGNLDYDGQSWSSYNLWYSTPHSQFWPPLTGYNEECGPSNGAKGIKPFPCTPGSAEQPTHYVGDTANYVRCEPNGQTALSTENNLQVVPSVEAMSAAQLGGKEPMGAPAVSFGGGSGWAIPPGGTLAAYGRLTPAPRPTGGILAQQFPLSGGPGNPSFIAGWTFKRTNANAELACKVCRGVLCLTYAADYYNHGWTAYRIERSLLSATINYSGALSVRTHPDFVTPGSAPVSWPSVPYNGFVSR